MEAVFEKWDQILHTVKEEYQISDIAFKTWLEPMELYTIDGNKLYIVLQFEKTNIDYINRKYQNPLMVAIAEMTGITYEIVFISNSEKNSIVKTEAPRSNTSFQHSNLAEASNLNLNYTFDNFIVGNNNKFAQSASLAVAESPGESYNPLYIHGGPGLGKTHLLHAIGNYILSNNASAKVLYVTSEEFTNEVIESIRSGNTSAMSKLREKYRTVDVLMVDDVQFIIGKESTQEEFFNTFNKLYHANKQIVLTSDKPPKELTTLDERFRSRFECGLLADVGVPDYETRMAILRKKVESDSMKLGDDILNYIANNIKSNVRELEGALNKLQAYSNLVKKEITMEIAEQELQNIITPDKPKEINTQLIVEVVSEHFNIPMEDILSKKRSKDIVWARQIAMYMCKNMTDESLEKIGALLGGRDHSTVIHGIKTVTTEYENKENVRNIVETIKKKINPN